MPKKKKSGGGVLRTLILIICIGVFCFSAYELIKIFLEYNEGAQEYHKIEQYTNEPVESGSSEFSVDYEGLRAINDEIVGWIRVPDTTINYPIMQTGNNDYYLSYTFERNTNIAGSIFMDYRNAADFSDRNTIIYGHNMYYSGVMFGTLYKTANSSWYTNPDNQIITYNNA